jgi:hypothetical protein
VLDRGVAQYLAPDRVNVAVNATHALVGYSTASTVGASQPASLVSGLGWLVRSGACYLNRSREYTPGSK